MEPVILTSELEGDAMAAAMESVARVADSATVEAIFDGRTVSHPSLMPVGRERAQSIVMAAVQASGFSAPVTQAGIANAGGVSYVFLIHTNDTGGEAAVVEIPDGGTPMTVATSVADLLGSDVVVSASSSTGRTTTATVEEGPLDCSLMNQYGCLFLGGLVETIGVVVCTGPQAVLCGLGFVAGGAVVSLTCEDAQDVCAGRGNGQFTLDCGKAYNYCEITATATRTEVRIDFAKATLLWWRTGHPSQCGIMYWGQCGADVNYSISVHDPVAWNEYSEIGTVPALTYNYQWRSVKSYGGPACYIENTSVVDGYWNVRWRDGSGSGRSHKNVTKVSRYCNY